MKHLLLATIIMATGVSVAQAGPSTGQASFLESSRRQDFTGQGTYHRIGLFREQRNATRLIKTEATSSARTPRRTLWQSFCRLFHRSPAS